MPKEITNTDMSTISPAEMLTTAIDKGVDGDRLEKLMNLYERAEQARAKRAYGEAMAQFRADCPQVKKTRRGHGCMYAGLPESLAVINPALAKNGINYTWVTNIVEEMIEVTCVISHVDGYSTNISLRALPDDSGRKNSIQAVGSSVEYLKRYTLFAGLGLSAADDDDGAGTGNVQTISREQIDNLTKMIADNGLDADVFKSWLEKKGISTLDEIQVSVYPSVEAKIKAAIKAKSHD